MPYTRVFIHYVWSTKYRNPVLTAPFRKALFSHILFYAKDKKIFIDRVNGFTDHVHCLIQLQPGQTIDGVIKLIKGESSHWFNNVFKPGVILKWQPDYFAVGVCESKLDMVREYIDNQELHHNRKTFAQEYNEFIARYGFVQNGSHRD